MTTPPKPVISGTVVVVCIAIVVCFTMAVAAAVFMAAPNGANTGSLIAILLAQLAPTIAGIAALAKLFGVGGTVDQIGTDTDKLANGHMDAKIRAGVADVVRDEYIDPTAQQQLASDRATRDRDHQP